jgi:hypothetical protein
MTREDYETQKRRLAEQHRALLEMVETAHQLQLRALEIVWRMMSGEGSVEALLPSSPAAPPQPGPPPVPPPQPARRRQRAGELYENVQAVLPQLPDPFVPADVSQAIGYDPDRGSLYRTLQDLIRLGYIAVLSGGSGNKPTQYRRTQP